MRRAPVRTVAGASDRSTRSISLLARPPDRTGLATTGRPRDMLSVRRVSAGPCGGGCNSHRSPRSVNDGAHLVASFAHGHQDARPRPALSWVKWTDLASPFVARDRTGVRRWGPGSA